MLSAIIDIDVLENEGIDVDRNESEVDWEHEDRRCTCGEVDGAILKSLLLLHMFVLLV